MRRYWTTVNAHVGSASDPAHQFGFTQMDWFAAELDKAAANGDAVWVLGHVPGDAWLPEHSLRYQQLVEKHAGVIQGQFYGHDHQDGVKLTRACNATAPGNATPTPTPTAATDCSGNATGVMWVGPSLTEGWPSENPALRVMEYEPGDGGFRFTAAKTYSADLAAANADGKVSWVLEYDTAEAFGMPDISARSFERWVTQQMAVNATAFRG